MSTFSKNAVTLKGAVAIAALVAGGTLEFTRIAVGDGNIPAGQTALTMTDLAHRLFDVDINEVYSDSESQATVVGVFNNSQTETGFFYRELGLFAKDPQTGAEILFCYGNAGTEAEWINAAGEGSVIEKEVHIVTLVGNATEVTATMKSGIYPTREQVNAELSLKADLDTTAAEGGRVVASQMRFDELQTLYVDAAATAEGADGSEEKPFKTIQAAVDAYYPGARVITIKIKAGTYPEAVSITNTSGALFLLARNGTGVVSVKSINAQFTDIHISDITVTGGDSGNAITIANVGNGTLDRVAVNGNSGISGIALYNARCFLTSVTVNSCETAIEARDGSFVAIRGSSGSGNNVGVAAFESVITCAEHTMTAVTPYVRQNGGAINVEGGAASFPSNFSQRKNLGDFTDVPALQAAILAELSTLNVGETRLCWFANNIPTGLAQLATGQRLICDITKTTDYETGYGIAVFYSHHGAASGYWKIHNGAFLTPVPTAFTESSIVTTPDYDIGSLPSGIHTLKGGFAGQLPRNTNGTLLVDADSAVPWQIFIVDYEPDVYHRHKTGDGWTGWTRISAAPATYTEYGTVKLADETALLNQSSEATLTVDASYELNDFRRMEKYYSLGDKVACAFRYELFLECTKAGTTSGTTLDTRNVTHGQVITDGTCEWTVRTHIKSVGGGVADANGNVEIDLESITTDTIDEIFAEG